MFDWSIQIPWWVLSLFALLSYGGVAYYYSTKYRYELLPGWRYFLVVARGTALFLLLLLLWNPYIRRVSTTEIPPRLIVLHDNSASVRIHPKIPVRSLQTHVQAFHSFLDFLNREGCSVDTYLFDQSLYPLDSLNFEGKATDLYQAIQSLVTEYDPSEISGVVLISDGIVNKGGDPRILLQQPLFPIYTLLMGDTFAYPDLRIKQVLYHPVVTTNTEHPLLIELEANRKVKDPVSLAIYENGELRKTVSVKIPASGIATINTVLLGKKKGIYHYRIVVDSIPNELTTLNNVSEFYVNVEDFSYHVALFAGSLSPDLFAIKQPLLRDQRFRYHEFVKKDKNHFYKSPTTEVLDSAQVFILYNFPESAEDEKWVDSIRRRVEKEKARLFLIAGAYTDYRLLTKLEPYLPLTPASSTWKSLLEAQWNLTETYRQHSTYPFSPEIEKWLENAPPLMVPQIRWEAKPFSRILATQKLKGITTDIPFFATYEMGNQRHLMLIGESLWRLRMETYVSSKRFNLYDEWLSNWIIWLCSTYSPLGTYLKTLKSVFTELDPILFSARLVNALQQPISDAEVRVEVWQKDQKVNDLILIPRGNGLYEGQLPPLPSGSYRAQMVAKVNGEIVAKATTTFAVKAVELEGLNLQANQELLKSISRMTKATFTTSFDELMVQLKEDGILRPRIFTSESLVPLSQLFYPWLFIVLCLTGEWAVRKWKGLV